MDDRSNLTAAYNEALMEAIQECKTKLHYFPHYFLRMLEEFGCLETAHRLIMDKSWSDGFTKLWELGRLDLSVEAITIRTEFQHLFGEDVILKAKKRLKDCGYTI
jgi:hypothetical protein